jgi:hypothetical protein
MNTKIMIHIIFILSLVLVTGITVKPAYASTPTIYEAPYTWSGKIDNECGIKINGYTTGTQRFTVWRDENGAIEKGHTTLDVIETWSSHGKTLTFDQHYPINLRIDTYPNGYVAYLGVIFYTIQGEGVVMQSAGNYTVRFTFDEDENIIILDPLKEVGREVEDWGPICEYFE